MSIKTSDLHVSAMVQIGKIALHETQLLAIDLSELAKNLEINENILFIEHGSHISKGLNPKEKAKKKKSKKTKKPRKYFYNQTTIHIDCRKRVNVKVFNNGRIQMTGINYANQGSEVIDILTEEINKISSENKMLIYNSVDNVLKTGTLDTVLINTDFDIFFEINREKLQDRIVGEGYHSTFEPCIYPGVNIKYFHNPVLDNHGICNCENPCNGKGLDNTCKKITIAVFKSGKIIITGGRSQDNIDTAYGFITEFINKYKDELKLK